MESWQTYWEAPAFYHGQRGPSPYVSAGTSHYYYGRPGERANAGTGPPVSGAGMWPPTLGADVMSETSGEPSTSSSAEVPEDSTSDCDDPACVIVADSDAANRDQFTYSVKIVNPQKKSDYTLRKWRINKRFRSVLDVQNGLAKHFKDAIPEEAIQLGYIKPGHGAKGRQQWIFTKEDLDDMYKEHAGKEEIIFWVLGRQEQTQPSQRKRPRSPMSEETARYSKKGKSKSAEANAHKLLEVEAIVDKLREKNADKFTPEQISVWAHLIHMKKHQSYEDPPDKPFFKGKAKRKPASCSSTATGATDGISPCKRIGLRTELLEQLEKLSSLFEKGIISRAKYDQLQDNILADINRF